MIVTSSEFIEKSAKEEKELNKSSNNNLNNNIDKSLIGSLKGEIEELKAKVKILIDNEESRHDLFEYIQETHNEKIKSEFKNSITPNKEINFC